jgi:hypothetical protein
MRHGNLITRQIFEHDVEVLRRIHGVEKTQAYRYMKECSCASCPGHSDGQPSTLHNLEKEIDAGLRIAKRDAKGEAPDYSKVRLLATHPLDYFNHKIEEIGADGFGDAETRDRYLKRVVKEHMDIVFANIDRADDSFQLREVEELQSVLEDYAAKMRGEIALAKRKKQILRSA